jgi:hypothetical protein
MHEISILTDRMGELGGGGPDQIVFDRLVDKLGETPFE